MSDAMAESLNYASQKRRAVSSRSYRVKISPVNGQNFTSGQTVNIDLPSNLAATYINWNQCYLKFKVTPTTNPLTIDKAASCFISRVQCMTAGAQIFDCPSWNVLMNVLLDSDSGPGYKAGYGNILMGTRGSDPAGEVLTTAGRVYCVPFTLHPFGMSTPHRLMPVSSSAPVQFKLTLASVQEAGYAAANAVPGVLNFEEVELVCVMTELSSAAEQQVQQMNGGQFNILANSWQAISTSMSAQSSAVTSNIGISVSSLERVIVLHRPNTSLTGQAFFSQSNRITNGLEEWSLLINGEQFPQRPIKVEGAGAEAIAEYLLSDHSLVNFDKESSFNVAVGFNSSGFNGLDAASVGQVAPSAYNLSTPLATGASAGTYAAAGNIGSFFAGLELETGLSDGRSQRLYSGISTISSTVNYRGKYNGAYTQTVAAEITFFLGYTVMLALNSRGTNVWSISV